MENHTSKSYFLYRIKKSSKDIIKIGITKDLFSRLTGKYENGKIYNGLLSCNLDIDKSFYIKLKSENEAKYLEEKIHIFNKENRINYHKELSGYTEWFSDGEKLLKDLKYFLNYRNEIFPLNNIFLKV